VRRGSGWQTLLGIDLDAELGDRPAVLALTYSNGDRHSEEQIIRVVAKDYPITRLTVAPKYVELSPEDQARAAEEEREIGAIYAQLNPEPYWAEPFVTPLPNVQGGRNFGHRRVFNGQARAPHSGADLAAATGTAIGAANRGRVVLAKDLFFSGNAVFVDHGQGVFTTYLHLSEIQVELGQIVERGEPLGLAGATGRVTGPHLHWGARVLDARVDPFTVLSATGNSPELQGSP
jgi:murein DD-endopeptidase MepM/ murein hydrolase activator NlpD